MELWIETWRNSIAPSLPTKGLENLLVALDKDDPRLVQKATVIPHTCGGVFEEDITAACPIAFCGWQGGELGDRPTALKVERFFIDIAFGIRKLEHFLSFVDHSSRDEMRSELAKEVRSELERRSC